MTTAIDLSKLPAVEFVPQLSIEDITASEVARLSREEGITLDGPEDPAYRIVRSFAYREKLLRHDSNEACRNLTLAFAKGHALDHIGITYHRTPRLTAELDEPYRQRIALAPEGLSVAGPENAYIFHAKSASEQVLDVSFSSPLPNEVLLTILSSQNDGVADPMLLNQVLARVNGKEVRAQGDQVTARAASILTYQVQGTLEMYPGPDSGAVLQAGLQALKEYNKSQHRLAGELFLDGIYRALRQPGVRKVNLNNWADIVATKYQAPLCTALNITIAEAG